MIKQEFPPLPPVWCFVRVRLNDWARRTYGKYAITTMWSRESALGVANDLNRDAAIELPDRKLSLDAYFVAMTYSEAWELVATESERVPS
jgi:hypothetical protein